MRIPLAIVTAVWLAAGSVHGQAPAMTVDFRVTASGGQAVTDLTPADVVVRIGGRERTVRGLQLIAHAGADTAIASPAPPPDIPPPFSLTPDEDPAPARHVLIVLNEGFIPFGGEAPLRDGVSRLLTSLSPRDRVGLISLHAKGAQISYTTDRQEIQSAIDTVIGGRGVTDACSERVILDTVRTAASAMAPGLSSTILLVSSGGASASTPGRQMAATFPSCVRREEIAAAERALTLAQVSIYAVHVGTGMSPWFNDVAGAIGAETEMLSFSDPDGLVRAIRSTDTYYRATFELSEADKPGLAQRLDVRVQRPGVRVKAPGVLARAADTAGVSSAGVLLRSAAHARDLRLRAAVFPSDHGGGRIRLVVLFEPQDPTIALSSAMVAAFDGNGEVVAQSTLRPAELTARPMVVALPVAPGPHRVRVAAVDDAGRGGTVDEAVAAQLTPAGRLTASALVLGVRHEGSFRPRLEFTTEAVATAYLEVSGVHAGANVTVILELAAGVDAAAQTRIPAVVQMASDGLAIATADLPIADLPAGDTLVRATVGLDGAPGAHVFRTLRKRDR